jgi:ATP phosphoribosyltransferase
MELGYGKCRLAIAAPKKDSLTPTSLSGKTIATSFPNLTKQYLVETLQVKDFIIKEISGSVEIAPTLGTADAVVDLVETGSTLKEAGMEIIDTIIQTQAVLISRKNLSAKEQEWLSRIQTRLEGILTAEKYLIVDYNIAKAKLKDAQQITPGMKSPTITALDQDGWVAVRSVILKNELYPVIEKLKSIGGQAILVSSMEYFQI